MELSAHGDKIHAFVHAEAVDLVRDPPVTEEFSLFLEEHVSDLVASARIFSLGGLRQSLCPEGNDMQGSGRGWPERHPGTGQIQLYSHHPQSVF